ncbi:MAG: Mur ligase domain-containing protein [Planctomycetota bacterium]
MTAKELRGPPRRPLAAAGPDTARTMAMTGAPEPAGPPRRHRASRTRRAHLVGVSGIGMSALARQLVHLGWKVSGSDRSPGEPTRELVRLGVPVAAGHAAENIPVACDLVIHTAAVGDDNPEIAEARARGLEIVSYGRMLGELAAERESIAVAGTHGKTTTSAILAFLLEGAGLEPGAVIGGMVPQLGGNALCGDGAPFVVEACEYRATFHDVTARHGIITNVDGDHLEFYGTQDRLRAAFRRFAAAFDRGGVLVTTAETAHLLDLRGACRCRILTVGAKKRDVRIEAGRRASG